MFSVPCTVFVFGKQLRNVMRTKVELPWLIQHMVTERNAKEPERHVLYSKHIPR